MFHLIIPNQIIKFIQKHILVFFEGNTTNNIDSIIILVFVYFEFLMYLIFLEIIELNFCGLNTYIKRNIKRRALKDSLNEDYTDSYLDDNCEGKYSDLYNEGDVDDNNIKQNELNNINQ